MSAAELHKLVDGRKAGSWQADFKPEPRRAPIDLSFAIRLTRASRNRAATTPTWLLHASCWRRPRAVAIKIDDVSRIASRRTAADELRGRATAQPGEGTHADRAGRRARRQGHLSSGTIPLALLLPIRRGAQFRPCRTNSRPDHRGAERGGGCAQGRYRRIGRAT